MEHMARKENINGSCVIKRGDRMEILYAAGETIKEKEEEEEDKPNLKCIRRQNGHWELKSFAARHF